MAYRLGDKQITWREGLALAGAVGMCLALWAMVVLAFCFGGNH